MLPTHAPMTESHTTQLKVSLKFKGSELKCEKTWNPILRLSPCSPFPLLKIINNDNHKRLNQLSCDFRSSVGMFRPSSNTATMKTVRATQNPTKNIRRQWQFQSRLCSVVLHDDESLTWTFILKKWDQAADWNERMVNSYVTVFPVASHQY